MKPWACWCKGYTSLQTAKRRPDEDCHGDILLALANKAVQP